jgi:hypothetical protein
MELLYGRCRTWNQSCLLSYFTTAFLKYYWLKYQLHSKFTYLPTITINLIALSVIVKTTNTLPCSVFCLCLCDVLYVSLLMFTLQLASGLLTKHVNKYRITIPYHAVYCPWAMYHNATDSWEIQFKWNSVQREHNIQVPTWNFIQGRLLDTRTSEMILTRFRRHPWFLASLPRSHSTWAVFPPDLSISIHFRSILWICDYQMVHNCQFRPGQSSRYNDCLRNEQSSGRCSSPDGVRIFSLHVAQTGFEAHQASYAMTFGVPSRGRSTGAWSRQLISN